MVADLTMVALIVQIPDGLCHAVFFRSYLSLQTWPGTLVTNIWLVVQVGCQIAASVVQKRAEDRVRVRHPGRFPPSLSSYLRDAHRRWRREHAGESMGWGSGRCCSLCCGPRSYGAFIRAEVANYEAARRKFGRVSAITGMQYSEVGMKRHQLYRSSGRRGASRTGRLQPSTERGKTASRAMIPQRIRVAPEPESPQ